ncbi:MAG: DUF1080 domain-containing protein [Candidatus Hydrogenedentes bacterium]|nr:DUF1080 domain-containing protein [Candidatus Hydrogenedentota bacterium]
MTRLKLNRCQFVVTLTFILCLLGVVTLYTPGAEAADETAGLPKACIDGEGPGWRALGEEDFTNVNGNPDTWSFKDGVIYCTGTPVGVMRTKNKVTNFELVLQWRHMKSAGNSGVFVWVTEESVTDLAPGKLPKGIEVQILDHGYTERYEKDSGKKAEWFTSNGDVFAVGVELKPLEPLSPDGSRSFPRKNLSKGSPEWNHYYIRAVNGEVRLWVNGEEVSGGTGANPSTGYLALESEGSPIEFKNLRIRELP